MKQTIKYCLQTCPNCHNKVRYLYSNWDNPVNNGVLNVCEYCVTDKQANKSKSLRELNDERRVA